MSDDQERWALWVVQARNFAKRENFSDAVARIRLVQSEVEAALAAVHEPAKRGDLQRQLKKIRRIHEEMRAQYDAWNSEIAKRRQATIDNAAGEMAMPLPKEATE